MTASLIRNQIGPGSTGRYALTAYNNPSSVTVHRINADGTLGDEVKQAAALDCGIFAHQVCATPTNDAAILVCRGNDAGKGKPEDPGALKVFTFKDGQLANRTTVAPEGGYGGLRQAPVEALLTGICGPFVLGLFRRIDGKVDNARSRVGLARGPRPLGDPAPWK